MTRPKGTVQVRLAKHRAVALATFLDGIAPQELTVLGSAGMSQKEVSDYYEVQSAALSELRSALRPASRGRPRKALSLYTLPVLGILAMIRSVPKLGFPARLLSVVEKLARSSRQRRGPALITGDQLRRRVDNGFGDERHVRRLRARRAKELAHAKAVAFLPPEPPASSLSTKAKIMILGLTRI